MTEVIDAVKGHALFDGLDEAQLQKLADIAQCVEFPEHKLIFREGDAATDVFFVTSGSVALEICARGRGCRRILTVGEGELLGWSPVLEQQRLSATARAQTATQAIQMNGRQILTICEHDPRFGYEFMKRAALALAKRLSATRLQLLDVYGEEMPQVESAGALGSSPDENQQEAP